MALLVTKQYSLSAVHHLAPITKAQSHECELAHGHHYKIRVTWASDVNSQTGLSFSRDQMDQLVREKILEPLEGQFLNRHFEHSSGEYLAQTWKAQLNEHLPGPIVVQVAVQETRKNWFSS